MSRRTLHTALVTGLAGLLSGCGDGTSGPSALPTPTPVTHPVTVIAYLDDNANGVFDANEGTRIPGAEIVIGSARATTAAPTGQATVQAPEGAQALTVTAASLPPFYRPPSAPIQITVPAGAQVMVPITLPRGSNRANVYMAFGDSITNGEPEVPDGNGYRGFLQAMLRAHFGAGEVANEGRDATDSDFGASIISTRLAAVRPAFTLIHYGTNDWNRSVCDRASKVPLPCFTTASLRSMVQDVNRSGGHAFLATIIPVNVGYDGRTPPERQDWVDAVNVTIKQVADQEGAVLVDLNDAFKKSGLTGSALYVDHLHPTTAGYQIMAQTWFNAITKAYSKILSDH
jgi:lysophospholipase L1-like esterase